MVADATVLYMGCVRNHYERSSPPVLAKVTMIAGPVPFIGLGSGPVEEMYA